MRIETMEENTNGTNRRMIEEPEIMNRKREEIMITTETKNTIVETTVETEITIGGMTAEPEIMNKEKGTIAQTTNDTNPNVNSDAKIQDLSNTRECTILFNFRQE
jgi:hypothetical protein